MRVFRYFGVAVVCFGSAALAAENKAEVFPATVSGVTLQKIKRSELGGQKSNTAPVIANFGQREPLAVVLSDTGGKVIYVRQDKTGKAACAEPPPADRIPLRAAPNAKPAGDWSVVVCHDGVRQWAYRGDPLFTFAKDEGIAKVGGVDPQWRAVAFDPAADVVYPANVTVRPRVKSVDGPVFADIKGMTLYVRDGDTAARPLPCKDECLAVWTPFAAPQIARPVGDWTLVERADGFRQWAFRGRPLYTYQSDIKAGDADGENVAGWHAAALTQSFLPPDVVTRKITVGLTAFATSAGKTLYARDQFRYSTGGHSINDGPPATAEVGRGIGTAGCDAACMQQWTPLKAGDDARSTGYWTVETRADGSRQWAYQGYALYTYAGDKQAGDAFGLDVFTFTSGAAALYWRVATP
jgi:predicted lipoprotein with Yx(FWY)xxD motif